ncbi:HPF/RaiA family ribosome-associated protein [Vibrio parahaemolyticus]|nr:HPF/RaiA family ribosome-associated protein [Vibrio parahaemolyticus]
MKLEFVGHGIEFTDAIKDVTALKLNRSFLTLGVRDIRVTIRKVGDQKEMAFRLVDERGKVVDASAKADCLYSAIDNGIQRVRTQLLRSKGKQRK